MSVYDTANIRSAHPGWAVHFVYGSWMGGGHGLHRFDDAFYATRYDDEVAADRDARECQDDYGDTLAYDIVPAWEPLCECLRHQIDELKKTNKMDPDAIFEMVMQLEGVLSGLKKFSVLKNNVHYQG